MKTEDIMVTIPEGVTIDIRPGVIQVKQGSVELERAYPIQLLSINKKDNEIIISSKRSDAKIRALKGTFGAHIKNMIKGTQEEFTYKLKVCSTHFPMSVKSDGKELSLSNFLGEKKTKKISIPQGISVKIDGEIIEVKSHDIEKAGTFATRVEQLTRIGNKDRRVFQDGIYMTEKAGKELK